MYSFIRFPSFLFSPFHHPHLGAQIGGSRDITDLNRLLQNSLEALNADKSFGMGNLSLSGSGNIPGTEDEASGDEPACEVSDDLSIHPDHDTLAPSPS